MPDTFLLGRGKLTWGKRERVSDRYGSVYLLQSGDSTTPTVELAEIVVPTAFLGKRCRLSCTITETRESTHIGDLFHGVFPRTPKIGDLFVLGEGKLFRDHGDDGLVMVGLEPDDGRETQWLNMRALYDCHEQTVELLAEEIQEACPEHP